MPTGLSLYVADMPVKSFENTRRHQSVFNVHILALFAKKVFTSGLLFFAGESVGDQDASVRQQFADFGRCRLVHAATKIRTAVLGLIGAQTPSGWGGR